MGTYARCISAFSVLVLALLCHIVGISTDYWTFVSDGHAGLWKFCHNTNGCQGLPQTLITGRNSAARGLAVTSLVLAVVITVLCLVAGLKDAVGPKINFLLAIGMNVAGMMCIVGTSVYAISADYNTEGGYSLGLTITAGILYLFVVTPLLLVEPIKKIFDFMTTAESTDPDVCHTHGPQCTPTPYPQYESDPNFYVSPY